MNMCLTFSTQKTHQEQQRHLFPAQHCHHKTTDLKNRLTHFFGSFRIIQRAEGPSPEEFTHRHLTSFGGILVGIVALISAASIAVARPLRVAFKIMSCWVDGSWLVLM